MHEDYSAVPKTVFPRLRRQRRELQLVGAYSTARDFSHAQVRP
jgi:hypothetical protein